MSRTWAKNTKIRAKWVENKLTSKTRAETSRIWAKTKKYEQKRVKYELKTSKRD